MSMGGHQSAAAKTTTWLTPPGILEALGRFDLDPCCPRQMPWRTADRCYTIDDDGLAQPWFGRVWLNPPYGRAIGCWMERMAAHDCGTALIFARTETRHFFNYVWPVATGLLFFEGRLNFHHPDGRRAGSNAGAPSVLVSYGASDRAKLADSSIDGRFLALNARPLFSVAFLPSWRELLKTIFRRQSCPLRVVEVYALVRGHPKTRPNRHWRAKVRQQLQRPLDFECTSRGTYQMRDGG